MEKQYSPHDVENKWYAAWEARGLFHADEKSTKPKYSIVIPPPNVTGILHMGHALNNTIQDILVRWKKMSGFETLWMPGTDHAGIATQAVVEKRLFEIEKKTRHDLGRDELVQRIWQWKDEYETRIIGQLKKLGCACDWSRQRFTLDPVCARAVRHTFFNLFSKGLIYRGKRLVNWDTHLQTAVADDEIFYETVKGSMWYFRYPIAGGGYLPVATTRPETILGDTAVAVHPDDPRYREFVGKTALVPFVNREIPVIADADLVDPAFGTGCVKVTPAHDPNDYRTGLRHKLPMINILNKDGSINENGGPFAGQDRYACRKKLAAQLEALGLLDKVEAYETQVGHSDRSKTPIEPCLSDQWFVSMADLAQSAMDAVAAGRVTFFPERFGRTYLDWLAEKRDWCISRQLWWGHQIPIWYCDSCTQDDLTRAFGGRDDVAWKKSEHGWLICAQEQDLAADALGPGHTLARDPDVLDTWFSSALWPHSTMGWPRQTATLAKFYPTDVLVTNRDIISLWVARMVITGQQNMGREPFGHVYIHATVLDGNGQRMSKSKGNGVDPLDIIEKYGVDALRYTMASLSSDNQDARLPVKAEKQADGRTINTSEKFEAGRNFANKLWNASRFLLGTVTEPVRFSGLPPKERLQPVDRWILSRLNRTVETVVTAYGAYRFNEACQQLYAFTWKDYCDWYVEAVKAQLYGDRDEQRRSDALAVCAAVLGDVLKLLHPVMPFITEEVREHLKQAIGFDRVFDGGLLLESAFPVARPELADPAVEADFALLQEIIVGLRTIRAENNVPPDRKGTAVILPPDGRTEAWLTGQSALIALFAKLSGVTVGMNAAKPGFAGQAVVKGTQIFLELEGLIDRAVEIDRLTKELDRIGRLADGTKKRLESGGFVDRAPADVVAREREKYESLCTSRMKIERNLAALKG